MDEPWAAPSGEPEPGGASQGNLYAAPVPPPYGTPAMPPASGNPPSAPPYGPPGMPAYGSPGMPPPYGAPATPPGRGRAPLVVAGIVLGLLVLGSLGLGVVGFVLAGRSGSAARPDRSVAAVTATGPTVEPTRVDPLDLRTGDCLVSDDFSQDIQDVAVVPCTQDHDAEMSGTVTLPETPWPGAEKVDDLSDAACRKLFEPYVGIPVDESDLDYSFITPRQEVWESGDRLVICLVTTTDGTVATPMAGSSA